MGKTKKTKAAKFNKNDGTSRTFHLVSAPVLQEGMEGAAKSFLAPFVPSNALKKENAQEQLDGLYDPIKGAHRHDLFGMSEPDMPEKSKKEVRSGLQGGVGGLKGIMEGGEDGEEGQDGEFDDEGFYFDEEGFQGVDVEGESYFPNDGYNYDRHLRPIGGGGATTFVAADGTTNNQVSVNKGMKVAHLNPNVNSDLAAHANSSPASVSYHPSLLQSATKRGPGGVREEVQVYSGLGVPDDLVSRARAEKEGKGEAELAGDGKHILVKVDGEVKIDVAGLGHTKKHSEQEVRKQLQREEAIVEKKGEDGEPLMRVFKDEFSTDLQRGNLGEEERAMLDALDLGEEGGFEHFFPETEGEKADDAGAERGGDQDWDYFVSGLAGRLVADAPGAERDQLLWGESGLDHAEIGRCQARKTHRAAQQQALFFDGGGEGGSGGDAELYAEADQALRGNVAQQQGKGLNEFRLQKLLAEDYDDGEIGGVDDYEAEGEMPVSDEEDSDFDEEASAGASRSARAPGPAPSQIGAKANKEVEAKTLGDFDDVLDEFLMEQDNLKNYHKKILDGPSAFAADVGASNEPRTTSASTPTTAQKGAARADDGTGVEGRDNRSEPEPAFREMPNKTEKLLLRTRQLELECGKDVSMRLFDTMSDVCSDEEEDGEEGAEPKRKVLAPLNDQDILKKFNLPLPKKEADFDCETVLTTMTNISNHPGRIDVNATVTRMREQRRARHLERLSAQNRGDDAAAGAEAGGLGAIAEGDSEEESGDENEEDEGESSAEELLPEVITVRPRKVRQAKKPRGAKGQPAAGDSVGAEGPTAVGETNEEKRRRKDAVKLHRRMCRENKKENKKLFKDEDLKLKQRSAATQNGVKVGSKVLPM